MAVEPHLRPSLFPNMPPFLNTVPSAEGRASPEDQMVELRESLWRVPLLITQMINRQEEEEQGKVGWILDIFK